MTDPTINSIDRFFDLLDAGVEKVDHVLNRGKRTEEQQRARRRGREVIDAKVVESPRARSAVSRPALVLAKAPKFYIVESITAAGTLFVVTDGGNARTECTTRAFAEEILRALEKAS